MNFETDQKIYGIYHSRDLDGVCSGAIIKTKYPNAIMIGYHYGEPIPELDPGVPVIMADVSLPMPEMEKMAANAGSMLWIDHHVSAKKDFDAHAYIRGLRYVYSNEVSACELVWSHLMGNPAPPFVRLLSLYDTWKQDNDFYDWDDIIMPFQYGMRANVGLSLSKMLVWMADDSTQAIARMVGNGRSILNYQKSQNDIVAAQGAFERVVDARLWICLNTAVKNSLAFESVYDPNIHDVMCAFCYSKGKWNFSLYSTHDPKDVDCSVIAKKYGGGGHASAAGFQVDDLKTVFDI